MHYVYILQSLKDHDLYTGCTNDLRRRFREHIRRPMKLIYYEAYLLEADAKDRERFLKSGSGKSYVRKQLRHYLGSEGDPKAYWGLVISARLGAAVAPSKQVKNYV